MKNHLLSAVKNCRKKEVILVINLHISSKKLVHWDQKCNQILILLYWMYPLGIMLYGTYIGVCDPSLSCTGRAGPLARPRGSLSNFSKLGLLGPPKHMDYQQIRRDGNLYTRDYVARELPIDQLHCNLPNVYRQYAYR